MMSACDRQSSRLLPVFTTNRVLAVNTNRETSREMAKVKNYFYRNLIPIIVDLLGISTIFLALTYDLLSNDHKSNGFGVVQISICSLGLFLTLIASYIVSLSPTRSVFSIGKAPSLLLFVTSLVLIGINIYGLIVPLRNPEVYQGIHYAGVQRVVKYSARQVIAQMNRDVAIDEQYPDYVKRLTRLIFEGTVHQWDEVKGDNSFHIYLPLEENYLIYLLRIVNGEDAPYEFCRAERAIERAASVCSQSVKIITNILTRNKVKAQIATLDGHVIVRARVDKDPDTWWILDPDYGVVIEHDLDQITDNPDIIRDAYAAQGYSRGVIENLVQIYAPPGNQLTDEGLLCPQENFLYVLKWLIPTIGFLPYTTLFILLWFRRSRT